MAQFQQSNFRIRLLVGILGITLPIVLPFLAGWDVISSISHYYYLTEPSLFFIIVLSSLAIFLISYKGYEREEDEFLNDDILTNLAGLSALLVVIIPTACFDSGSDLITELCCCIDNKKCICDLPLLGHHNKITGYWHFGFAAFFVFLMGYMSFIKFPRGEDKWSKKYILYKVCGFLIWSAIVILGIYFLLDLDVVNFVFWMEAIAVWAFGIAWLVKGKPIEASKQLIKSITSKPNKSSTIKDNT